MVPPTVLYALARSVLPKPPSDRRRNDPIETALPLLGLALVAMSIAWLLRRGGVPGAAIVAGLLLGVLAGPDVLGRAAPEVHRHWFAGAAESRSRLERSERIEMVGRSAVGDARLEVEIDDRREVSDLSTGDLREQVAREERLHRRWARGIVVVLATLLIAAAGRDGVRGWRAIRRRRSESLLLGAWVAVVPAGLGMVLLQSTLVDDGGWASLFVIAAALAIGPWRLDADDVHRAAASEADGPDLLRATGLVASAVAAIAAAAAAWSGGPTACMAVIGTGLGLGLVVGVLGRTTTTRAPDRRSDAVGVLLAPMVAIAMLEIGPREAFGWWPILVAAILTADGRYLGAVVAGVLPGSRRGLRAMRLFMPLTTVGPTQSAVAAAAIVSEAVPASIGLALLIAAAIPEVTAPFRGRTDRHLREAEAISEQLDEDRSGR